MLGLFIALGITFVVVLKLFAYYADDDTEFGCGTFLIAISVLVLELLFVRYGWSKYLILPCAMALITYNLCLTFEYYKNDELPKNRVMCFITLTVMMILSYSAENMFVFNGLIILTVVYYVIIILRRIVVNVDYKRHTTIAKYISDDISTTEAFYEGHTDITLTPNSSGGYYGSVSRTPGRRHISFCHKHYFIVPGGAQIMFNTGKEGRTDLAFEEGKYGILSYSVFEKNNFKFTPAEDQEEAKALFESQDKK